MIKNERKTVLISVFIAVIAIFITGYFINKNNELNRKIDALTNPQKAKWEYFSGELFTEEFSVQFPYGWTVSNVNKPRQYVFMSPGYIEGKSDSELKVVKGGWISLGVIETKARNLQDLRENIEKNIKVEEIKNVKFIDQDAIWYSGTNKITGDYRVILTTVKNGMEYSLLLVYNPKEPNTENYYYVFNEMARRFSLAK